MWFFEPMHGAGYQFWSGIGSDISELTIIVAMITWARHKNCHKKGCWRLGHPDPEHGHPVCRKHQDKL